MCHQLLIGAVVPPQFTEVVGKVEPAAEQLRITGKARVVRIPLDMNNTGFRQCLVDQPQMPEIGRQLIGDPHRGRRKPMKAFEVAPPQLCHARERYSPWVFGQKLRCLTLDPSPLARAEYSRMARHHLFDQACTRTGHADNENWKLGGAICCLVQPFRRETCLLCMKEGRNRRFIIRNQCAIQGVATLQMREGAFITAKVIKGFEQRKMQFNFLRYGLDFFLSGKSFQLRKPLVIFFITPHLSQGPMIGGHIWCQFCGARECCLGFTFAPQLLQDGTMSHMGRSIAGINGQGLCCTAQRFFLMSQSREGFGAPEQGNKHPWVKRQSFGEEVQCGFGLVESQIHFAEALQYFRVPRRSRDGASQRDKSLFQISLRGLRQPQCVPSFGHLRFSDKGCRSFGSRFRWTAKLQEKQAEMLANLWIVRCGRGCFLQQLLGFADSAGLDVQNSQAMHGARVSWRYRQYGPILSFGLLQSVLTMEPDGSFKEDVHIGLALAQLSLGYKRFPVSGDGSLVILVLFSFPAPGCTDTVNCVSVRTIRMPLRLRLPAVAVFCMPFLANSAPASPSLIPLPVTTERVAGSFTLDPTAGVGCSAPNDAACRWTADYLSDLLRRTRGLMLKKDSSPSILLRRDPSMRGEAYRLKVQPSGIEISAGSNAGLLYGAVTLWQLATSQTSGRVELPLMDIKDAPRFSWRGVLLDTVRHYQSPEFIKRLVDVMALHKLNVLQWHLTDDQGWRLEIKKYPRLTRIGAWRHNKREGRYGGFYSQNQVREIVAYAAQRNVTIVPEIEMPGHATAAIVAYPKLASAKRSLKAIPGDWGVFPNLYNVDETTFTFLENVLTEVMVLFPSHYIHVGGDEAPKDQWNASAAIQKRMRALGVKDSKALQGYFTARIGQFLEAHGRHLIGWDEILEENPPANAAVMSWRTAESAGEAAEQGHDVVLSTAPQLYLDYCQAVREGEPTCRGMQTTLHDVYTFNPTSKGVLADHLIGMQANIWTEHLPTSNAVSYAALPRLAAFSESAWSPEATHNWTDFLARLPAQLERYKALGLRYSSSAFVVDISARPGTGGATLTLSNQTGYGTIHYTFDGIAPTTSDPVYAGPFQTPLPVKISAAAFDGNNMLAEPSRERLDTNSILRRNSYTMDQCTNDLPLAQRGRSGAIVMVNVMNPCWIYHGLDLSNIRGFDFAVTSLPFNFQIGRDIEKIPLYLRAARSGQLEIRLDSCSGEILATRKLAAKTSKLHAAIAPHAGTHDLCFVFARRKIDPVWAIDWVQPVPRE